MFQVLKNSDDQRKISHNGYTLGLVAQVSDFEKLSLEDFDGFVIDTNKPEAAHKIITHVRVKNELQESLKPLFLQTSNTLPKFISCQCDGVLDKNQLGMAMERVAVITDKIHQIKTQESTDYETMVTTRVLGFLYTRNNVLQPILHRQSSIGYSYPMLSLFFKENEAISMLQLAQKITANGMVNAKLKDQIHLCKGCHGNYFNFREVCASCNSIDISPQDMIHHFVCAHVAPAADFKKQEDLSCPKCDKHLRHIGIDYDKPSTIYHCNTCSHEFQQPKMEALCLDCETINDLEELIQQPISEFSITQKGEQLLFNIQSKSASKNTMVSLENKCSEALFQIVLKQEIARVKTHDCKSVYAQIHIKNETIEKLNTLSKQAFHNELLQIISPYLLASDVMASESYELFHLLLPNTSFKELERLETIEYNVQKLLNDNIEERPDQVSIKIHKIVGSDEVGELVVS